MKKNIGIGILIVCFSSSTVNLGLASQVVEVPPIIVEPFDNQAINQQAMDLDRRNRDEEIAIKQLIEKNDQLTRTTLTQQQDEGLSQVNQTMLQYRDALNARERQRIIANSQWNDRYGDLVRLTEDTDDMTVHRELVEKSGMLTQKYQMLNALKDEMTQLNDKLTNQHQETLEQKQKTIEGFEKLSVEQQEKIKILINKLGTVDGRIAQLNDLLEQKEKQIAQLKENLSMAQDQITDKDRRISVLEHQTKTASVNLSTQSMIGSPKALEDRQMVLKQQAQIDLLKSELEKKITQEKIQEFKSSSAREVQVQSSAPGYQQDQRRTLEVQIKEQSDQLRTKDETIRWLNRLLDVTKTKSRFDQLSAQQDALALRHMQDEMGNIKSGFTRHAKDYNQFEGDIGDLKARVAALGAQLTQKQGQIETLQAQLNAKNLQVSHQEQGSKVEEGLRVRLQAKENQITQLKADITAIKQSAEQRRKVDDRLALAKQLIRLQDKESSLLDEKSNLEMEQNEIFDRHFSSFENRMKTLIAQHKVHMADLQARMEALSAELTQAESQQQVLQSELKNKIAQEKNQTVLTVQIQDLTQQLRSKEDQITALKAGIIEGQKSQAKQDSLQLQLTALQEKADTLKSELDNKTMEAEKLTTMAGEYQKKLESKNNDYNEQLRQVMSFKKYQSMTQQQIADLNLRLQEKEAQVVAVKRKMYELQEEVNAQTKTLAAKDLTLSMVQQKAYDGRIKGYQEKVQGLVAALNIQAGEIKNLKAKLVLANEQLKGAPSSDETQFLRAGLKKAEAELLQKNALLTQAKANADEYAKAYKAQSGEFKSLKDQLQEAQDELGRKLDDLKYKDMALVRMKEQSRNNERNLLSQVRQLTQKLNATQKQMMTTTHENRVRLLEVKLEKADLTIKDLQGQLDSLKSAQSDPSGAKLRQALEKIDQQGRVINLLAQKLQDYGHSVNLTEYSK